MGVYVKGVFPNTPIVRRNFPFVWSIHPPLQLQGSLYKENNEYQTLKSNSDADANIVDYFLLLYRYIWGYWWVADECSSTELGFETPSIIKYIIIAF